MARYTLKINRDGSQSLSFGTDLVATVGDNVMGREVLKILIGAVLKFSPDSVFDEYGNCLAGPAKSIPVEGDTNDN